MKLFNKLRLCAYISIFLLPISLPVYAQNNILAFDNQSGEHALVKVIGPSQRLVEVPTGTKGRVNVKAGIYSIKVRYGDPGKFNYTQGEEFEIKETQNSRSVITITLHKVVNGNYETNKISANDFGTDVPTTSTVTGPGTASAKISYKKGASYILEVVDGNSLNFVPVDGATMSTQVSPAKMGKVKQTEWDKFRKSIQEKAAKTRCAVLPLDGEKHTSMLGNGTTLQVKDGKYVTSGQHIFSHDTKVDNKVVLRFGKDIFILLSLQQDSDRIVFENNEAKIGIGSELRFPDYTWVDFLGFSCRRGGLKIGQGGLGFFLGTQKKQDEKLFLFNGNKWVEQK